MHQFLTVPRSIVSIMRMASPFHLILSVPGAITESVKQQPWALFECVIVILGCLYIVFMMIWTYYMACTESPGTVMNGMSEDLGECRLGPGSSLWWNNKRQSVATAADMCGYYQLQFRNSSELLPLAHSWPDTLNTPVSESKETTNSETFYTEDDLLCTFRFCKKCPLIPMVEALARLPPGLRNVEKMNRRQYHIAAKHETTEEHKEPQTPPPFLFEDEEDEGLKEIMGWLGENEAMQLVYPPKPERAHHCRSCKTCVLKYDHHCPWINQCVGLGNERYFILFMLWFSLGCCIFCVLGWRTFLHALRQPRLWTYTLVHRLLYLAIYAKAAVMGFAVFVLACWHLTLVSWGETSVEHQDNVYYRQRAKETTRPFRNCYDLGWSRNLKVFFNVGSGMKYTYFTLLLPIRVEPYSDGWHWAKRAGLRGRHLGVEANEELTDDDGEME